MFVKVVITLILLFTSSIADIHKKGEKIYSIMCDKEQIATLTYLNSDDLKRQITSKKLCGSLNKQNLEALTHYIIESKDTPKVECKPLIVPKKARCPVCGMFTAKYPKWVAIIEMENQHTYYFDGVKDMMKFYFDPEQFYHKKEPIAKINVTDYYTLEGIDAKKAFYVIGSNIYGPMGEELIPFATKEDAKHFLKEHNGKKIHTFDTIEEKLLY